MVPGNHDAYVATIRAAMSVARAAAIPGLVFTTGRRSERFSQAVFNTLPEEAFIQIGDFFEKSLRSAAAGGIKEVVLAVFFGKAVKMAQGIPHTPPKRS